MDTINMAMWLLWAENLYCPHTASLRPVPGGDIAVNKRTSNNSSCKNICFVLSLKIFLGQLFLRRLFMACNCQDETGKRVML